METNVLPPQTVVTSITGALPAGTNNIGDVDVASMAALVTGTATIGAVKDAGPNAGLYQYTTSADMTGAADLTPAPAAGLKLVITDLVISVGADMVLTLLEETSGTVVMELNMTANSPVQITPRGKLKLPVAEKKLRGDASVAGEVNCTCFFYTEA